MKLIGAIAFVTVTGTAQAQQPFALDTTLHFRPPHAKSPRSFRGLFASSFLVLTCPGRLVQAGLVGPG
jgi:hypothetical protein